MGGLMLAPGVQLGPYEIVTLLGAGGMGEVYRARDPRLEREVAVKILPASFSGDPERLQRFEREARATAALNHPNILAVFDIGTHESSPFIVSELLEGASLRDRLSGGALPQRKAIDYALQIARGLAAAHDKGIIHRDLKPENVYVTNEGNVKILDFGLAKLIQRETSSIGDVSTQSLGTKQGQILGTVGYMSPEQVRGQQADARSDIFALGAILYEMISGRRAFHGDTGADTMSAILSQEPPDLAETGRQVPPALERILHHCLEKNADQRFQSARDVVFSLETLSTVSETTQRQIQATPRRRWLLISLLGSVLGLSIFALGYLGGARLTGRPQPDFHRLTYRRGTVREARFMPDGQNILYTAAWDGGAPTVYSTRFDSTESGALAWDNTAVLAVSARGELALLTRTVRATYDYSGTLATASSAASAPREVETNVNSADWGPDGTELALIHNSAQGPVLEYPRGNVIYRKKPDQGPLRSVRVAPQRDLLAVLDYVGSDDGRVVILDQKGNKQAQSPLYGAILGCAWSPDGREIWYAANGGPNRVVYGMDLSGKVRLVLRVPGKLTLKDVSRQGLVLLCRDDFSVATMFKGRGEKVERNLSWFSDTLVDDLSADGQTMIFSEGGAATEEKWGDYLRKTDGSPAVRLGDYLAGKLSPDGKWVLAQNQFVEGVPEALFLLPTGAGQIRKVTDGKLSLAVGTRWNWLPDSSAFFFTATEQEGKRPRTYVQQLDGGNPVPVTPEGVVSPLATPDGKFLIVRDSPTTALLHPIGQGPQTKLQGFLPGDVIVRWHADGKRLLVERRQGEDWEVSVLEPYSGKREHLRNITPSVEPTGIVALGRPLLSADGECYAYYFARTLSELYVVTGVR